MLSRGPNGDGRRSRQAVGGRAALAAIVLLAGLVAGVVPVGAQDSGTPANPTYCASLRQLTDVAPKVPVSDEQYRQLATARAELVTAVRADGPADLQGDLDEFERVVARFAARIDAAGGVSGLSYGDRVASTEESAQVYYRLLASYDGACPGAKYPGSLVLACDTGFGARPPSLEVGNNSDQAVLVSAGDLEFTVDPDGFEVRSVPTSLRAADVSIGGIDGLVVETPCDDPPAHCVPTRELIRHAATLPDDETFAAWSAEQRRLLDAVADVNRDGLIDIGLHILEDQLAALVDAVVTAGGNPADVDPATWNDLSGTYLRYMAATADMLGQCPAETEALPPSDADPSSQLGLPPSIPASPAGSPPGSGRPTAAPLSPKFTG